jgi:hypothetical protein
VVFVQKVKYLLFLSIVTLKNFRHNLTRHRVNILKQCWYKKLARYALNHYFTTVINLLKLTELY